jgi:hypothetical protein
MRVHAEDEETAADLAEFLRARVGAIVERAGQGELEVSLLGSYNSDALRGKLEEAVRRWAFSTGNPAAHVEGG